MREILFRGKLINCDMWVEGWFVGKSRRAPYNPPKEKPQIITQGLYCYEVRPETVGQYTGLTDKNGKKIFEGDIIKNEADYVFSGSYKCEVVFNGGKFYGEGFVDFEPSDFKYCEVIGNIHDNPELLNE